MSGYLKRAKALIYFMEVSPNGPLCDQPSSAFP
nr:MAG TPA: hypothetical protein [Caudoviricetes sp.]